MVATTAVRASYSTILCGRSLSRLCISSCRYDVNPVEASKRNGLKIVVIQEPCCRPEIHIICNLQGSRFLEYSRVFDRYRRHLLHSVSRPSVNLFPPIHSRPQDGRFDCPDRLFYDIDQCWRGCIDVNNMSDVKELTPEFFYCPEIFLNSNKLPLGEPQVSTCVLNH